MSTLTHPQNTYVNAVNASVRMPAELADANAPFACAITPRLPGATDAQRAYVSGQQILTAGMPKGFATALHVYNPQVSQAYCKLCTQGFSGPKAALPPLTLNEVAENLEVLTGALENEEFVNGLSNDEAAQLLTNTAAYIASPLAHHSSAGAHHSRYNYAYYQQKQAWFSRLQNGAQVVAQRGGPCLGDVLHDAQAHLRQAGSAALAQGNQGYPGEGNAPEFC